MSEIPAVPENVTSTPSPEAFLGEILANQQQILENQKKLLSAERSRRIWGIVKIIVIGILIVGPLLFLPAMINSMMGGMLPDLGGVQSGGSSLGGLNLEALLGNPAAIEELLMGQ